MILPGAARYPWGGLKLRRNRISVIVQRTQQRFALFVGVFHQSVQLIEQRLQGTGARFALQQARAAVLLPGLLLLL